MTAAHSRVVTASEFDALFDRFEVDVARLETLPGYAVGGAEAERLGAYHAGRARPLRSVVTDPWLARIAISTLTARKSWTRVRILDEPLTEYQRYQLQSYRESQAVGEQVSIAARDQVGDVGVDFWLFDHHSDRPRAVLMHYHFDGRLDRRELVEDRELIADLGARLRRVADRAVPLNEFLARISG